jgi:prepilin-type N-terminal cleavage/methylation domain-containing protein
MNRSDSVKLRNFSRISNGFTIVELLVVIVVIGVLASISLISYTGISNKAKEAAVIADLTNTTKQLKLFQIENSGFPETIRCDIPNSITNKCIKPSGDNALGRYTYDNSSGSQAFCLTVINSNIKKHIDQDGVIADNACTYAFPETIATNNPVPTRYAITLSWPAITGAESYILQRATNSGFTANLTTLTPPAAGASSYTSSGLTPSTTYYYRMKVTIAGDESNWSPAVSGNTLDFPAPSSLASSNRTSTSINFSWGSVGGAALYTLERATDSSFTSPVTAYSGAGTSATASSLSGNSSYYFRVKAVDGGGSSGWSSSLIALTLYTMNYSTSGSYNLTIPNGITSVAIEVWGAEGSGGLGGYYGGGGRGGYAKGNLAISTDKTLNIYVGGGGNGTLSATGGYNGGGNGAGAAGGGGGGASDVRYGGNTITPTDYRKIVAGGGGGGGYDCEDDGGYGGGITGGNGTGTGASGGPSSPTAGFSLGIGTNGTNYGAGGGGGYYGGKGSSSQCPGGGGGGSGYVGGVTSTTLTAGDASMPAPGGGTETGHGGNGYVRIIY